MNEPKITERDDEILNLVAENEPVRSKTLVQNIYWADSTKDVNYRLGKLEDAGLIEREEVEDNQYPLNPKVAWITEDGHQRLATLDDSTPLTLEQRVEKMEKQMSRMRETYGQVKQRIVELEGRLDELEEAVDDDFTEVADEITRLRRLLEDEPLTEAVLDAKQFTFSDD